MLERSEGEEFDFESRIVSSGEVPGDGEEVSLRPKRLDEYVGQNKVKENLKVYMEAAKSRKESLDHVLLYALRALERPLFRRSLPKKWE